MTQKDKLLLIKDLSARLPYAVTVEHTSGLRSTLHDLTTLHLYNGDDIEDIDCGIHFFGDDDWFNVEYFKPYLFPLSSMTEEQRNDISKLLINTQNEFSPYGELNVKGCDNLFICVTKQATTFINYCLTHHLDINGLIEKGLALDATGLNIY